MNKFTHLHVHTEYSLLDGSSKIKELLARTKELGMDSIAITDHGVMYGAIDFYKEAKKQGVKPIIGCEVYVAPRSRLDKEGQRDSIYYHLVLLAENKVGYHNLMKLVSSGFTEGFYYKPRIDLELLQNNHEGLIGLSACLAGSVANKIINSTYEKAKEEALIYNKIFGQGNFYLELQDHGIDDQKKVNQNLIRMSQETGIPLVATNDVHYTYKEDSQAHDILLCIQTNKKVQDEDRMKYFGGQFYLKSPDEMSELFPYAKSAIENTVKIADRCNVDFKFHELKLPRYDVPEGYTAKEYLRKLCLDGLKENFDVITDEISERLEYELSVIENMGYVDYFLIVWDFVNFAKQNNIMVGPGRGSAAGSLVSYCLKITNINPLQYQLLFERFLNPERVSMPDIDIDFCYERRQEVIDYVVRKYGEDRVAQIVTFGTMAARAVIRDVGRALDMSYAEVDKIAKMIPNEPGTKITIDRALEINPELSELYEENDEFKYLIDMSKRLEGLPRHCSTHAAGVVICQQPVVDYVPLSANDGAITTQYTMTTLEELGLLKMDFLGLRTLTVIQNAVDLIKKNQGIDINLEKLDFNDSAVYDLIGQGKCEGVFQLESSGMKSFMKELKPRNIEDIIAGISLFRPGPMDFIPRYIKGKEDPSKIEYTSPQLEPILNTTYGCIVYQEQVMQIVRDLAGYSLGRSDLVRRAMSKKKVDVMEKERQNFIYGNEEENIHGCIKKGVPEKTAAKIFDEMTDFAKYAFNKSHATAYAVIAYQTGWLKAHYPVEFMAALITSFMSNTDKVSEYIMHIKNIGIELLPPDINEGYGRFSVSNGKIRYGLSAIKNVGRSCVKSLVEERNKNGKYESLTDFCQRMNSKDLNKRMLEGLIKAGAFDSLGGTRKQYMVVYKKILDSIVQSRKRNIEGQVNLFQISNEKNINDELPQVGEYPKEYLLSSEKEAVGIYLSGHPLENYKKEWEKKVTSTTVDFYLKDTDESESVNNQTTLFDGEEVTVGGIIMNKTVKTTKNNKIMAFITLEDLYGSIEVIIFPNDYERNKDLIFEDNKIFIKGRVSVVDNENSKLICQKVVPFINDINKGNSNDNVKYNNIKSVWLKIKNKKEWYHLKNDIVKILKKHSGNTIVKIYLEDENIKFRASENIWINASEELVNELTNLLSRDSIALITK